MLHSLDLSFALLILASFGRPIAQCFQRFLDMRGRIRGFDLGENAPIRRNHERDAISKGENRAQSAKGDLIGFDHFHVRICGNRKAVAAFSG